LQRLEPSAILSVWRTMAKKKRTKTDFTEQDARQRQFREYLARKEEARKQQQARADDQQKAG